MFDKELIQAVSDWQRGGDAKQKARRGQRLLEVASELPEKYRTADYPCFRQIALTGSHLRHMGTEFQLAETISSWTNSETVARGVKGGVPPMGQGYQGVIFVITPPPGSVVVNLISLFSDGDFQSSVNEFKSEIIGFGDGIGRYSDDQQEVVLNLSSLPLEALHAWGGYSSDERQLAARYFCRPVDENDIEYFRKQLAVNKIKLGPYWLTSPNAVKRVSHKLKLLSFRLAELNKP